MNSLQLLTGLLAPVGVLFCTVFKLCSAATSECMCNWVLFICKLSRVCSFSQLVLFVLYCLLKVTLGLAAAMFADAAYACC